MWPIFIWKDCLKECEQEEEEDDDESVEDEERKAQRIVFDSFLSLFKLSICVRTAIDNSTEWNHNHANSS